MSGTNSITGQGTPPPPVGSGSFPVPEFVEEIDVSGTKPLEAPDPDAIFPVDGIDQPSSPSSGGGIFGPISQPEVPGAVAPPEVAPGPRQPAPPIVTGLNLTMKGDPKLKLDPKIEKLLNASPHLKDLWQQALQKNFKIQLIEGNESRTDFDSKPPRILIGKDSVKWDGPPDQMALKFATLLAHEIGHAANPYPGDLNLRTKPDFVDTNLGRWIANEAQAYFDNAKARHEILGPEGTGPDIGIRGRYDNEMTDIYNRHLAGEFTKEQAIAEMGYWAEQEPRRHGDGSEGTTREVFRRALEQGWDETHKK
jgi:hypothetical protein